MRRRHDALCCECGANRTVAKGYVNRREPIPEDPSLCMLRCQVCERVTAHAVVRDVELNPVTLRTAAPLTWPQASVPRPAPRPVVDVADVLGHYWTFNHMCGFAEKTIEARTTFAKSRLNEWWSEGFTPENIRAFLGKPGLSRWSRSTYHAHMKALCEFLVVGGFLPENPMEQIYAPRRPKSPPRPLSEAEVERVLSVAEGRVRDWILLALDEGLRAHEIAKVRGEDITAEGIYVLGKGGSEAVLPVHPDIAEMVERYPERGPWFPGRDHGHVRAEAVTMGATTLFRELGIEGSMHRCRHTYATRLLRSGINMRVVQQLMRHSSVTSTAIYTAVDEAELREGIARLPTNRQAEEAPELLQAPGLVVLAAPPVSKATPEDYYAPESWY